MQIHQMIKEAITHHRKEIELTQWAVMAGVSSLVYSDFISRFRQKIVPIRKVMIPSMKSLNYLFRQDGDFITSLSNELIARIADHSLYKEFSKSPELVMFNPENVEIMKTIFDLYIIPNVIRRIPEAIDNKFGISDDKQQMFQESNEIDILGGKDISLDQMLFIVEETILHMLANADTVYKHIDFPNNPTSIHMTKKEVLMINNDNALCPIYINSTIIENEPVIKLLKFITSTNIMRIDNGDNAAVKGDEIVRYSISTNVFNEVSLLEFICVKA